ncbi:hypothetical protein ACFWUU_12110 [Kribbella sp. NPDC058693]|uniref:hypothetical protein n=1 Tax=Kribbella sp. NPDC058693 TaxID=3346602 RepID=UPI003656032B
MKNWPVLTIALTTVALLSACSGGGSSGSAASPTETSDAPSATATSAPSSKPATTQPPKPVETESNPPGDIPDNQAFFTFRGSTFTVKVPEGWARSVSGTTTSFTDKLNRIEVMPSTAAAAPTAQSATTTVVPTLRSTVPRFALGKISEITRPAGKVVLITYQGDSAQDPVTGKVIRDAFERYLFSQGGKQLALTLVGPVNADNVDPWKIVSDSVRWL